MIQQTIDELREMKSSLEKSAKKYDLDTSDIETLNKAIIACEQLRKARKKAKRWKRKYLELRRNAIPLKKQDGIRIGNIILDEWLALSDKELKEINDKVNIYKTTARKAVQNDNIRKN